MKKIETYEDLLNCSFIMIREYIKNQLTYQERYNIHLLFQQAKEEFGDLEDQLININPKIIEENDNELLKDKLKRYKEALRDY